MTEYNNILTNCTFLPKMQSTDKKSPRNFQQVEY